MEIAWSNAITITNPTGGNHIHPDIFLDNYRTVFIAATWVEYIFLSTIDVQTVVASEPVEIWQGSGQRNPETPHIYKKGEYHYLIVAEGGADLDHVVTVARPLYIYGPYERYVGNPMILMSKGTNQLFKSVGHADLFPDISGNWWAVALTTRSGPELANYPMGRETVLALVTWNQDGWPGIEPVRGIMQGSLPRKRGAIPGDVLSPQGPDSLDFSYSTSLPWHLIQFDREIQTQILLPQTASTRVYAFPPPLVTWQVIRQGSPEIVV